MASLVRDQSTAAALENTNISRHRQAWRFLSAQGMYVGTVWMAIKLAGMLKERDMRV
jgi:hypothetical protein